MAPADFGHHGGNDPLIEALARGWGVLSRCDACDYEGTMSAPELLERFHQHLDLPVANVLAGAICRGCGGPVRLQHIQTVEPLPYEPAPVRFGINTSEGLERMRVRMREFAAARGPPLVATAAPLP